jgi:Ca-activated chloride channel family protein
MAHPHLDEETLTQYVLGELDPQETAAVKEALLAHPDARRTVEELEQTIGLLTDAFAAEEAPGLDDVQRWVVNSQLSPNDKAQFEKRQNRKLLRRRLFSYAAVAAGIVFFLWTLVPQTIGYVVGSRTTLQGYSGQYMSENSIEGGASAPSTLSAENEQARVWAESMQLRSMQLRAESAVGDAAAPPQPEPKADPKPAAAQYGLPVASAAEPAPEVLEHMKSLGYVTDADDIAKEFRQAPQERWRGTQPGGESYEPIHENAFVAAQQQPLSTFSIDVDTASYANVRRFITSGQRPPADAVRIEELINYFEYDYRYETRDKNADPFTARVAMADSPWSPGHKLVRVGIAGKTQPATDRAPSNLVFLLDVSGSMQDATKLPLLKQGLQMLVKQLGENDRVSIVVYAGSSGVVLEPTRGDNQRAILEAIERLEAGGSTNGGAGIELAYRLARQHFIEGGTNRVLLATDGDFNVGVTSQDDLVSLIEREAKSGVFLTLLGFGMGNLKDGTMEQLSNKGNGNYAYIDSLKEAKKVLVDELQANLVTIAKDVKIQVEFNPARVQSYRLIGYENRALAARDFNDDTKDAGEIGAGHSVTALYEIVPAGGAPQPGVDALKYQTQPAPVESDAPHSGELMTLKIRYKQPEGDTSKLLEFPIADESVPFAQADDDFRFAASVAAFGMLLRNSAHSGTATWEDVGTWASSALGTDPHGYRIEFADLVRKAAALR